MKLNSSIDGWNNRPQAPSTDQNKKSTLLLGLGVSLLLILFALIGYRLPWQAPDLYIYLGVFVPALLLVWHYPIIGLIGLSFLTASILEPDLVDIRLSIGGGFDLRDLMLFALLGVSVFRNLALGKFTIPWLPVGGPLLIFLALAAVSLINALLFKNVPSNWAFNDFRILLYYTLYFVTAWSMRSLSQLTFLLLGLFIVADITAAVVIIQQFLGAENHLLESMSYGQWQVWAQDDGTIRVVPPGHVLMHFMMIIAYAMALLNVKSLRQFLFFGLQFAFLATGLLLTFTRAGWIASFIGIVIVSLVIAPRYREYLPRLIVMGLALMLLLVSVFGAASELGFIKSRSASSLQDRFTSIFTPAETLESYSLQWRIFEFYKASEAIANNPVTGVSLGNSYRNLTTFQGEAQGLWTDGKLDAGTVSRYTRFIHSSYLSIATKMGLTGIFTYLWFCLAVIIYGSHRYRMTENLQMKAVILAVIAGFVGLLQWSIFHAWLIEAESTSVIGMMIGILAGLGSLELKFTGEANRRASAKM